ncbi:MAG: glycerol-3-phosphate dehydrogenase/oxidase [Flavobacteriales bacterium]|nr:glycerol-3-phosphate dehydrogenase/oxidase [Flavobacteriales bacterium]
MNRQAALEQLHLPDRVWDVIVIGGGASGLGIAVDAASRGLRTVLFEAEDFAKGTSSRSTKLVHGGVRYLAQGHIGLVREALRERGYLARNARHLVHDQRFIIPCYRWWEKPFYRIGLGIYDLMAGALRFGRTRSISRDELLALAPNTKAEGLHGGVIYHDGRFDDARLAIELARTAVDHGACVLNHIHVSALLKDGQGSVTGVHVCDGFSGETLEVRGKAVVNATGVFTNAVMAMDRPDEQDHIVPSQGIHLVVDRSFLPGDEALMIPRTTDGRVLFAIPWHDHVVLGTTDTLVKASSPEPHPLEAEIDLVLDNAARYLARRPTRADVRCMYAGLRPLAASSAAGKSTKEIMRSHKVITSTAGLISLIGGKWTTYRKMAEDVVDLCVLKHGLHAAPCRTRTLSVHGNVPSELMNTSDRLLAYGSEAAAVRSLIQADARLGQRIHPDHPFTTAEVVFAVRHEMACTVEDVLARRVRLLFIDAMAARECAEQVARLMAKEAGRSEEWIQDQVTAFRSLATGFGMPSVR